MTEYREQFDNAPFELHEFAGEAAKVEDAPALRGAALGYLKAKDTFEKELEKAEVNIG